MSNIDIGNEFSFGLGLSPDQVAQIPKFNLARGKIIPIQLDVELDATTWVSSNKASDDANYSCKVINYPTPFFIIASSRVYNINKVNSMPYNDPRATGKNSDTTTLIQYTVVQGDETNYGQQDNYTESATMGAGGNSQLARNFYFTPFQGQITQSMVPVYLLPIKTTVKNGPDTYLYAFVRADIFITNLSNAEGSAYSYTDYLKNPQNYLNLNQPNSLPNYTNLPDIYPYPYTGDYIYVKNLVFLSTNYIGNSASVNSHASFCRFLTYDDMYSISSKGNYFTNGNSAGPVFFGLEDKLFNYNNIPVPPPVPLYPTPPYGNSSIPPYYLFSGRPYSIFFGLHLNTNTFINSNVPYGNTFNNYGLNFGTVLSPLPDNTKGYPVNFLTSLGNNNPTNGALNTTSNNTSYVKVSNTASTDTQSFFQSNSSNYIGSTYDMDEYYIANSRTNLSYGLSGASSFYNIYKFSLNKYIRFYSGTDSYVPMEIPYDTGNICTYNGGAYNGYRKNTTGYETDYDSLNCNTIQAGIVQNMTLQFVPLTYFIPPTVNSVPSVTDISMAIPIGLIPATPTDTKYINNSTFGTSVTYTYTDPGLDIYNQVSYQIVGGGGGGGGGAYGGFDRNNTGGGGGGSGNMIGYVGGTYTDSGNNTWNYNLKNYPRIETVILPNEWEIEISLGSGGAIGSDGGGSGDDGGDTTIIFRDISGIPNDKFPKTFTAYGGKGGTGSTNSDYNGNGGKGFNGGGGGGNGNTRGDFGGGDTNNGGENGLVSDSSDNGGDGGGNGAGSGGYADNTGYGAAGGGGGAGSGVTISNESYTGGRGGSYDGVNTPVDGMDYTGGGGGGGSYDGGDSGSYPAGIGGIGYAIIQFSAPIVNRFKFPNPDNILINNVAPYPSKLPTTTSSNIINPLDLFNSISSLYANSSSVICNTNLEPNSKCGFIPTEYYNSLNRYFYTEAPDLPSGMPNCDDTQLTGGYEYDPPVVVGQTSTGINIYNSVTCPVPTSGKQNLCVPNFKHLSNQNNEKPFKCIHIPTPDINPEYVYESYYGMYNEVIGIPVNDNLPDYFKQNPDKKPLSTIPSYTSVPYPKPINVENSTKTETFWNSTLFIVLAVIISVVILITIIVVVVKFSKKPDKYANARVRYVS